MAIVILTLLIALPLVELLVLIEVGGAIGGIEVIALSLLTAALGLYLVRMQGLSVLQDAHKNMVAGEGQDTLIHTVFLAFAGLMLMFPGFLTDAVGALLLIPPVRLSLGRRMAKRASVASFSAFSRNRSNAAQNFRRTGAGVVDGDFKDITPGSTNEAQENSNTTKPLHAPQASSAHTKEAAPDE